MCNKTVINAVLAGAVALGSAAAAPHERTFEFEYAATVKEIPAGSKQAEIWMAVPQSDEWQQITNLHVDSPFAYEMTVGGEGNRMLHIRIPDPKVQAGEIRVRFRAVRKERIQSMQPGGNSGPPSNLARWLQPDRLVPLDDRIRGWAREVVEAAHAQTDLEMARAIYNHVVATVKYDKTGQGWGRGDIYYACEARRGNCTDFHAIFIGYARALGIPARFAIGFPLPMFHGSGRIAGYHCWAEFYAKGIGWIPVDASEAAKDPTRRQYFFGAHDENRIEFSKGRDVLLSPRQQGEPLNYFVYPYVEVDGRSHTALETRYAYKDVPPAATRSAGE